MSKGTYIVNSEGLDNCNSARRKNRRDTSFGSCLCTLLVFLVICGAMILATLKFTDKNSERDVEDLEGYVKESTKSFEKLVIINVPKEANLLTSTPEYLNTQESNISSTSSSKIETTIIENDNEIPTEIFKNTVTDSRTTQAETKINTVVEENYFDQSTESISTTEDSTTDQQHPVTDKNSEMYNDFTENVKNGKADANFSISTTPVAKTTTISTGNTTTSRPTTLSIKQLKRPEKLCTSSGCITTAARILNFMNHSADACEDFYEFACGGRMQAKVADSGISNEIFRLVNGNSTHEGSSKYLKDFATFYHSCLEHHGEFVYENRIEQVKQILSIQKQLLFSGSNRLSLSVTRLYSLLLMLRIPPIFDVGLNIDYSSKKYILQITLPGESSLPNRYKERSALSENQKRCLRDQRGKIYGSYLNLTEIHEMYLMCRKNYTKYLKAVENSLRALRIFNESKLGNVVKGVENILILQQNLPSPGQMRKGVCNEQFIVLKLSELQEKVKMIDWHLLFRTLSGKDLSDDISIQVFFMEYLIEISEKLSGSNLEEFSDGLFAILVHHLFEKMVVPKNEDNCLQEAIEIFSGVISLNQKLDKQQSLALKLLEDVKTTFKQSVETSEWLDDESRTRILSKINDLHLSFDSNKNLSEWTTPWNLTRPNYPRNLVTILTSQMNNFYSLIDITFKEDDIFKYFLDPMGTEPITIYPTTAIAIPFGYLKQIKTDIPDYLLIAKYGWHLARAVGRHFDPVGIEYGLNLTTSALITYNDLVESTKIMLLYASPRLYDKRNISFQLDGGLSTNLRIAENTAFKIIIDLLKNGESSKQSLMPWLSTSFSKEKIASIATAQEFCENTDTLDFMLRVFENEILPSTLRIENIMSNSEDFSNLFDCPEGSGMNNILKKYQFPYLEKVEEEDYNYNLS